MKHTKGKWHTTFNTAKERGVRNEGGFICFLPKPSHYSGQDERYENELDECKANAKLISKAPEMHEALKEIFDYANEPESEIIPLLEIIFKTKSLLKEIES